MSRNYPARTGTGPHTLSLLGIKRPGREADHSPNVVRRLRMCGAASPFRSVFSRHVIQARANFRRKYDDVLTAAKNSESIWGCKPRQSQCFGYCLCVHHQECVLHPPPPPLRNAGRFCKTHAFVRGRPFCGVAAEFVRRNKSLVVVLNFRDRPYCTTSLLEVVSIFSYFSLFFDFLSVSTCGFF
jgi:hypothetical protein